MFLGKNGWLGSVGVGFFVWKWVAMLGVSVWVYCELLDVAAPS